MDGPKEKTKIWKLFFIQINGSVNRFCFIAFVDDNLFCVNIKIWEALDGIQITTKFGKRSLVIFSFIYFLQLKDLTVAELKYYLTANNLHVAGKKEALISRILTHMGKQAFLKVSFCTFCVKNINIYPKTQRYGGSVKQAVSFCILNICLGKDICLFLVFHLSAHLCNGRLELNSSEI